MNALQAGKFDLAAATAEDGNKVDVAESRVERAQRKRAMQESGVNQIGMLILQRGGIIGQQWLNDLWNAFGHQMRGSGVSGGDIGRGGWKSRFR